jgi:Bacterial protein of unknown function (DUF899)
MFSPILGMSRIPGNGIVPPPDFECPLSTQSGHHPMAFRVGMVLRFKVEKTYVFDRPNGKETLADFAGRSRLIVYYFMTGRPRV